jgi:hypothetical protein
MRGKVSGRLELISSIVFFFDLDRSGDIADITVGHMNEVVEVDGGKGVVESSKCTLDVVVVVFIEGAGVESSGEGEGSRRANLPAVDR